MTEEYFPRGGKKPNVTYFKQSSNFLGAAEKGQGKKKKQKKRSDIDDGYLSDEAVKEVDQSYKMCAAGISYKILKPGVNLLGRVYKVLDTKMCIMMPGKTEGSVMACHVSEPYNKMLEAYVNDETEKVRELSQMFTPGQYVAVHVLEANGGSENVMLSMMPQHVNSGRSHSDLLKGDILQAAVSSVEDHGYVMDIGVADTRAFLPKDEANPEVELDTGMVVWTSVKSVTTTADNSIVSLSATPASLQRALRRKKPAALEKTLLPGTAVEFVVDKSLDNGIEGRVLDCTAYVQRCHVDRSKDKKPALGQKIRAHVLYVMPTRNAPFLTTRDIFEGPDLGAEMRLREGDIVDEAQVLKIASRSVHFKLGKKSFGTMSLKRVAVHEDLTDEQIVAQSYPIGSTHRVRVLLYNLSDYIYHVTDQPGLLAEKYFTLAQLSPGELVSGTVRTVADHHVIVAVGRLSGYVPHLHLSDAGVYVDPKKATTSKLTKKKYKVGQEVSARVLSVDSAKQKLTLSLKPSLVAPEAAVLTSYEDAEIGKAYTGIIRVVKDFVLVSFIGDVMAYVPRNQVTDTPDANLSEAFHPGQVVTCTVLQVDPRNRKMLGSLTIPPFWPAKHSNEHREKRTTETEDVDVPRKKRKTSESDTDAKKKKKDKKNETKDAPEDSDVEDTEAAVLKSYDDAEIGKAYTGSVKVVNHVKNFILVSFKGDVLAYVPRNLATRSPDTNLSEAFHPGQVVTCTVLQVDPRNRKMLGSLTIPPFWPAKHSNEYHEKRTAGTEDGDVPRKTRKTSESDDTDAKKKKKDKKNKTNDAPEDSGVEDTEAAVLKSYDDAEIGKAYTGSVKVVKDFILVSFKGDVLAYVPHKLATTTRDTDLSEAFHPGQVVTCTVLQVDPRNRKMLGSLTIPPFWPAKHINEHQGKRKAETAEDGDVPRKKRKTSESDDTDAKKKKKDKRNKTKDADDINAEDAGAKKKNKDKTKKVKKSTDVSEESDAIETDIHEDSDQVLKPEDLALIDFSDCETAKQWKKRVVSLMKSINCRLNRIKRIDQKIAHIEEEGLSTTNKKYHTAMHQEKLVIEERIKKLMEAMKTAQEKLKEFDEKEYRDPNYKEKQRQKKEEKLKALASNDNDSDDEVPKKKNKKDKLKQKEALESPKEDRKETKKTKKEKNKGVVDKSKEIKVVESLEPALEVPSAKDFWSEGDNIASKADESSSSSENEETEQPKKKRKKLTAAEKVAKARAEEERLRELERRAVESEAQPRSSDQFERALLANPNCSQLWIAYMAFHLQATEIDKARAVGRKALSTISFREEHDKLNVWLAMLNLENRFGTKESQQKTLEDALQMNDTFKVHSKLLDIYVDTSKHQELSSLVDLMLRKYKRVPANYIQCGAACFKLGLVDKARHVMQKAVSVLEKKEHVTVLVQFALLERAHGERERAEALFEQVLAIYPQRLDVCAAYADMLAKDKDIQAVRQVMERMTSQKLPARKMKTLFNKWAELEGRLGDAARAQDVRERAVRFMETAQF